MTAPDQTNAEVSDERLREIERPWLLVKRGFYWRPEGMGYTAFKAEAGRYTDADAAMIVDEPGEGTSRIRYDDAEEFSPACPDDAKVRMLMVERSRLRTELLTRRSVTSQASEGADDLAEFIWAGDWQQPAMPAELADKTALYAWGFSQSATLMALIDALKTRSASPSKRVERLETATHRHVKRGSEYVLIGYGKMQAEHWKDGSIKREREAIRAPSPNQHASVDMRAVAIYRFVDDGSLWVRPREEFEDGRFKALQGGRS